MTERNKPYPTTHDDPMVNYQGRMVPKYIAEEFARYDRKHILITRIAVTLFIVGSVLEAYLLYVLHQMAS